MTRRIISCFIVLSLLAGCGGVSPQSAAALQNAQAGCAAGDQDACTAANYQAQANAQEAAINNQNAAAAATGLAAILGLGAGIAIGVSGNGGGYHGGGYHYHH